MEQNFERNNTYFMLDATRQSKEQYRYAKRGDIAKIISLGRRLILDV